MEEESAAATPLRNSEPACERKYDHQSVYEITTEPYTEISAKADLAQGLATLANSMMFLGVGMMVAISTIINGVLHNSNGELSLDDDQASWVGSLMMLFQPVGCIISGFLQQFIGRKTGMLLMNIPELIAWILMYTANSPKMLFISVIMMGLSAGFMEAPGLSYIGEISQPRIRGVLTSFANINISVGMLFAFFLGSVFDWRTTVAISAIVPIVTIAMIAFIPDSPVWLLNKGKKKEALQALCWLRGWVAEDQVKVEYEQLCQYIEASKLTKLKLPEHHAYVQVPSSEGYDPLQRRASAIKLKLSDLFRPTMIRPFGLIIGFQFFFHCAALSGIRAYMIETFASLGVPVQPQWMAFVTAGVMLIGGVLCITTVPWVGKRKLSLISMTGCSLSCILIAIYARYQVEINIPWIPMGLLCFLYFMTMVGIAPIPWMLISEVFPCRGRSFGASVSAASFYIIAFVFGKTYLNLFHILGLDGCLFIYGGFGLVGIIFLYFYLPETEGKTLAEVEAHFAQKK